MNDGSRRSTPPTAEELAAAPQTPLDVIGSPTIQGEIQLSDGTTLQIVLVVPTVAKLEGMRDPMGKPMYNIETHLVIGVKQFEREH